jgi:hypothetical protein
MQAHKLGERLLANESLRLKIHLRDGLGGQALTPLNIFPLSHTKLHHSNLQNFNFLSVPSWGKGIIPETF